MSDVMEGMGGITPADIAERWYARLMAPDCSLREREQFEAWLGQSPENALAFEDTKALWGRLGGLEEDDVLAPHVKAALTCGGDPAMNQWTEAAAAISRRPPARRRRYWGRLAASVAASLVLGWLLVPMLAPAVPAVAYEASNKIESIALADGSSVQLDLGTTIAVEIGDARRDIELRQGRAMFEVAHDAKRPFVVDAGVGTITALGTQFQVQRNGDLVSVTLLEGSVGITATGDVGDVRSLRLVPGQTATYAPATSSWTVEAADVAALTSWSKGFHVFGATPLSQALSEINRYSDIKLKLADPRIGNLAVSGSFKLGDGRAVSEALPYALPVRTTDEAGEIVISRR